MFEENILETVLRVIRHSKYKHANGPFRQKIAKLSVQD